MNKVKHAGLFFGAALLAGSTTGLQALEVSKVELGVVDLGGAACPRDARVTAWAHTDGPGAVKFVIRNDGGGKTGELSANAVKGAAGNWLATYSQTFKITTDVDIKYMAEAVGHGKISNWVNFKATCGPQVRDKKSTTTTSGPKPPAKHISEKDKPQPRTTTTTKKSDAKPPVKKSSDVDKGKPSGEGKPIPSGQGKPIPGAGKPIGDCKPMLSATRTLAVTRAIGTATAQAAWQTSAAALYGVAYGRWTNAKNQSSSCTRKGLTFDCTVKASPCK